MSTDFTCFAEVRRDGEWRLLTSTLKEQTGEYRPQEFDFGGIQFSDQEMAKIFGGPDDAFSVMERGDEIGELPGDCSHYLLKYEKDGYTPYPGTLSVKELKEHLHHLGSELSPRMKNALERSISKLSTVGDDDDVRIVYWFS